MTYGCDRMGISDKYCHLLMATPTYELLRDHTDIFDKNCNGVGSKVGWQRWFYHFIPNTIWFLYVKYSANIHDVEYVFPNIFETRDEALQWKSDADHRFLCNMEIQIRMADSPEWLTELRLHRASVYYDMVKNYGEESFFEGKTILADSSK